MSATSDPLQAPTVGISQTKNQTKNCRLWQRSPGSADLDDLPCPGRTTPTINRLMRIL